MRLLIIADNALSAEGIRSGLRHVAGCEVIGYVDARRPCGVAVAQAAPDVVVVDETSAPATALSRIREVRAAAREAKLVMLTMRMDADWLREAARAGIDAAIAKTVPAAGLGLLVREVVANNVFHAFAAESFEPPPAASIGLTARELEILRLVAAGTSNARIAAQIWVTEQTVKFHLSNIYRKLGVANRTQASHYAHVNRLLEPQHHAVPQEKAA